MIILPSQVKGIRAIKLTCCLYFEMEDFAQAGKGNEGD
jgi:hypothetical protein